jgi:hypothetical protein
MARLRIPSRSGRRLGKSLTFFFRGFVTLSFAAASDFFNFFISYTACQLSQLFVETPSSKQAGRKRVTQARTFKNALESHVLYNPRSGKLDASLSCPCAVLVTPCCCLEVEEGFCWRRFIRHFFCLVSTESSNLYKSSKSKGSPSEDSSMLE